MAKLIICFGDCFGCMFSTDVIDNFFQAWHKLSLTFLCTFRLELVDILNLELHMILPLSQTNCTGPNPEGSGHWLPSLGLTSLPDQVRHLQAQFLMPHRSLLMTAAHPRKMGALMPCKFGSPLAYFRGGQYPTEICRSWQLKGRCSSTFASFSAQQAAISVGGGRSWRTRGWGCLANGHSTQLSQKSGRIATCAFTVICGDSCQCTKQVAHLS